MRTPAHLKSLQALELAIRLGTLKNVADHLGITPAAAGQRVRALEDYLGIDLLLRSRSGLKPTAELALALDDLRIAFAALDRVTEALDFQRTAEIHIVADPDWSELWLMPRLSSFRAENPNILFCINGEGDVPLRLGAPDFRIAYRDAGENDGEELYRDILLPVTGPDNLRRLSEEDDKMPLEGMPLLHLEAQRDDPFQPGWPAWIGRFGYRRDGAGRGVHYRHARQALEAVRQNVGFLISGYSLVVDDLRAGRIILPFPIEQHITAPRPYVLSLPARETTRPQVKRFCEWLRAQSALTQIDIKGAHEGSVTRVPT